MDYCQPAVPAGLDQQNLYFEKIVIDGKVELVAFYKIFEHYDEEFIFRLWLVSINFQVIDVTIILTERAAEIF